MPDVSTEKLNAAAQTTYKMDYPGAMQFASGLKLDPNGICRALYGKELNACYNELLGDGTIGSPGLLTSHALVLDGTSGCWCTTPDAAALDIVGDIDLRAEWQQSGTAVSQTIISKWNTTGNQRSYEMMTVFGLLRIRWSTTGTDELDDASGDVIPAGHRSSRVTLDVVNGANHTSEGFSAPSGLGAGTLIGTRSPVGNTSIFSSSAVLGIGANAGGTGQMFTGRIFRAEVRSSIGGAVVASPDFRNLAPGTTSFVDSAGLTWTVQGTARIA